MSAFDGDESKREIIIVRRGGGDHEDGHHGGMWKIAFADFMTAMMCFFLVMWLVNAANEQTKASIASYFNPMTLVDSQPASKGLEDPGETESSSQESSSGSNAAADAPVDTADKSAAPGQFAHSQDQAESEMTSDQHLFSDPYAVLAEIAAQTATLQNISAKGDGGAQTSGPATGAQGGESYRDPFAPDFWSQEIGTAQDQELDVFRQPSQEQAPERRDATEESYAELESALAEAASRRVSRMGEVEQGEDAAEEVVVLEDAMPTEPVETVEAPPLPPPPTEPVEQEQVAEGPSAETQRLAGQIRQEIMDAFGEDSELNRTISVTASSEGVLISVTDELNYGMFEVGSAVPQRQLVLAMEQIGQTLAEHNGRVRIKGHTDGRPFRSASYDNWRLSTARAHAAYYMLVRGGMSEGRIHEVAGLADRELKIAEDPYADANRRIEIFLEAGG